MGHGRNAVVEKQKRSSIVGGQKADFYFNGGPTALAQSLLSPFAKVSKVHGQEAIIDPIRLYNGESGFFQYGARDSR